MSAAQPLSPVHDALLSQGAALSMGRSKASAVLKNDTTAQDDILKITDLSLLPRTGVKGPGAAEWLGALGLTLPTAPNSWHDLPQSGLIARLGQTEYLIDGNAMTVDKIKCSARTPGVYPLLRQDMAFSLGGSRVNELLLQTCNVDFRILDADPSKLVMTSMVGVTVTVVPIKTGANPAYRLWCDGTYGPYLWKTLTQIINEPGDYVALDSLQ